MKCPICTSTEDEIILTLDCGNPDGSTLYPTVKLAICSKCGHAYNVLSQAELDGLIKYYNAEYAPANVNAIGIEGDRPGSADAKTIGRYSRLFEILSPFLLEQSEILDVGCAMGGFLHFLRQKGYIRLSGVEMTETYVEQAKKVGLFQIERGEAEALPFNNKMFDVIVMEQVMEHLLNPAQSFREARRVLSRMEYFLLVFLMHPDIPILNILTSIGYFFGSISTILTQHIWKCSGFQNGFELLEFQQASHAVMSEKMIMPDVYAVFRANNSMEMNKNPISFNQNLKQKLQGYVDNEAAARSKKMKKILELAKSGWPVYIWGIGREFLYLYESVGLKECNIAGFIDRNPLKQEMFSINNMRVNGENILADAKSNSTLVITAIAHDESINTSARTIGFMGEIFDL